MPRPRQRAHQRAEKVDADIVGHSVELVAQHRTIAHDDVHRIDIDTDHDDQAGQNAHRRPGQVRDNRDGHQQPIAAQADQTRQPAVPVACRLGRHHREQAQMVVAGGEDQAQYGLNQLDHSECAQVLRHEHAVLTGQPDTEQPGARTDPDRDTHQQYIDEERTTDCQNALADHGSAGGTGIDLFTLRSGSGLLFTLASVFDHLAIDPVVDPPIERGRQ